MWKGVCGWGSLDCCLKVCTCMYVSGEGGVEEEGERVSVDVGVTVWM